MKIINVKSILAICLFMAVNQLFAQVTETRELPDFNSIRVGDGIQLTLTKGKETKAKVTSSRIDLSDVEIRANAGNLTIRLVGNHHRNIDVNVDLTYKELSGIRISSAADVTTNDAIYAKSLELEVSSAGEGKLEIDVEELSVDVESAGSLTLSGRARSQNVDVSSAGTYKAYDLVSENAVVKANSAGVAKITVNNRVDAKANSAGTIRYKGDPEKVFVSSHSGGHASRAN